MRSALSLNVRPCVMVSPDEINRHLRRAIGAPLTTAGKPHTSRVACRFPAPEGMVVLDQPRTVDQGRLVRRLGQIERETAQAVFRTLQEVFAG